MTRAREPDSDAPLTTVIVVAYDMARELPRTLRSLDPRYQSGVDATSYEVVVVDNGSPHPPAEGWAADFAGQLRSVRLDPAPASPVRAANLGLELARGELIGMMIDGARLVSPGLLTLARRATRLAARPVITTPAWHLGSVPHMRAGEVGYDQGVEDALLTECGWERDGYRLFAVSTLAGSSGRGIFGPMGESNALFLTREMWEELGGYDERFTLPGGGLANHDLYRRACDLEDAELIVLLGEGTFHQYHGGASTSRRFSHEELWADYERVRGRPHRPPENQPLYLGRLHPAALAHVEASARRAREAAERAASATS